MLRKTLDRFAARFRRRQEAQALDADLLEKVSGPRRKTERQLRARAAAMEGRRVHRAQLIAAKRR